MGKKSGSREGFKQVGESGFEKLEVYILIQRAIYFIYFSTMPTSLMVILVHLKILKINKNETCKILES